MRQKLLHAERDAALFGINLENARFNFLADGKKVRRLIDAAPGNFRHVQKAIDATNIDKSAVIGQAADGSANGLAFLYLRVPALFGGALFFFSDDTAVNH